MSCYNLDFIDCPNLQDRLTDAFECNNLVREPMGLLEFLWSGANRANVLQTLVSPGRAKIRTVELLYTPREPESIVDETINITCTGGDKLGDLSHTYELDTDSGVYQSKQIDFDDLKTRCEDDDAYMSRLISAMMEANNRKMATIYATQLSALTGGFNTDDLNQDGTPIAADVKVISTAFAAGDLDYRAQQEIRYSARRAAFCSNPVVFGEGEIIKYAEALNASCCWQGGVDPGTFASQNPITYIPDFRVTDATGNTNGFISLSVGAIYPLWYNRNTVMEINEELRVRSVLVDPFTGIPYDFRITENCETLTIELYLATALVGLPTDMFCPTDKLTGVTYVQEFDIINP